MREAGAVEGGNWSEKDRRGCGEVGVPAKWVTLMDGGAWLMRVLGGPSNDGSGGG